MNFKYYIWLNVLNFVKENGVFSVFLLIILIYRMVALYHFKFIDFEDANIAIMSRDIINGVRVPLYAYGVPYNAGEVIDAFILSLFFKLFNVSGIVIKILAIIESIILVVCVYFISKKLFDKKIALLGALLFSLSPSMIVWNYYLRGYLIDTLFYLLVFYYFTKSRDEFNNKNIIIFGLISGISFWMKELVIILLFSAWCSLIIKNKNNISLLIKNLALYFIFFIIGYFPSIIYNFTNDFLNWKTLVRGGTGLYHIFLKNYSSGDLTKRFIINPVFSTILFSEPYNDLGIEVSLISIVHWAIQLLLLILIIIHLWKIRNIEEKQSFILKFILGYLSISFILLTLGFSEPEGITGVRFYVLLYPLWIMLISSGISLLYNYGERPYRWIILLSIIIIIFISLFQHFKVYKNDFLIKEYEYLYPTAESEHQKTSYPVAVKAKSIGEIIKFLNENNIKVVFTTLTLKMRLLIESKFNLCIASYGYYPLGDPYPECREEVLSSKNVAVIHLLNSPHIESLENALKSQGTNYLKIKADDYVIFYPVDMRKVFKK